jgi:hypothetical protein
MDAVSVVRGNDGGAVFREPLFRAGRATLARTAKSCGPGAPMLALSLG